MHRLAGAQPLYHGALPTLLNLTVLNGLAATSRISQPPSFAYCKWGSSPPPSRRSLR